MKNLLTLPFGKGRILYTPDNGSALVPAGQEWSTNLTADHYRRGRLYDKYELGSGVITAVGAASYANDFQWASNQQTLKLANFHATGTGATAAAITDIALQTSAGPTPSTGTQSNTSVPGTATYKTSGTITYASALSITEWALFLNGTLSAATGSPATATSATTLTATGTPFSANQFQGMIIVAGTVYGIVASNTTSVITLLTGWINVGAGTAGATPGATSAFTIQPVMLDHKVFGVLTVANTDQLVFNYSLTFTPGG